MKSQIKRFSKSTLSVLLSICMLISCMTVGIIATDAALVSDSDAIAATVNDESVSHSDTNTVYFKNTQSWSSVYVYFYSGSYWDFGGSNHGGSNNTCVAGPLQMSVFNSANDIYSYTYTGEWKYIAFTEASQSGYDHFHKTKVIPCNNGYSSTKPLCTPSSKTNTVNECDDYEYSWTALPTFTVSYTLGSHINKASITGGDDDGSGTITATVGSNVVINVTYDSNYTYDSANSSLGGATASNSNKTFTFSNIGANKTISIAAKSSLTQLSAPQNVKLDNTAANWSGNTTTVGAKVRLSWDTVTNAGSYKVYKGNDLVAENITNPYYDIERAYSSSGSYSVVAVPSNTSAYSESNKSTARTLTVNKSQLNTPTVSVSPTDIKNGDSVELLVTDTNSSFTSAQFNYYYYTGNAVTISDTYKITAGTEKTLSPTADTTYKVCAYPVNGTSNDYYTQSYTGEAEEVKVYSATKKIAGELVGTEWNYNSGKSFTNYTSDGIFYYATSSVSSGDHYFKLYDASHGYSGNSDTNNDCTVTLGDENVYTLTKNDSKSFKVNGGGVFMIFYDTVNEKIWVTQNTWAITPHVYYQSYNLTTDSYNAFAEGTTGGTISPDTETLITKNSSQSLSATPASGYSFVGWYSSSDFASAHLISSSNPYSYTPTASGDYYALFKQDTPTHYNVKLSFTSEQVNLSATYNGTTISTNGATLSVPVGASVSYSMFAKTGAQITAKTPSSLITANSGSFTMPSSETTIKITSSWIKYNLTGVVNPAHGNVEFYSNDACTTEITSAIYQQTVYAKYTPADSYQLHDFTYSGAGITNTSTSGNVFTFKMGNSDATITANVILQYSVKYYVDMHDNNISGTPQIAIVTTNSGTTVATDSNGAFCQANLTREGNSTVYSATVNTPVTQSGSGYSAVYVKITATLNGTAQSHVESLATNHISTVINTHEVWFEAKNEASQPLALSYQTNSTTNVADGYRRIYLAKPYSWEKSEAAWENIGIYHWGGYDDIGWNYGIKMHYLGYSGTGENDYHYYYADIPKAINDNKVSNIIFQGWGSNTTNGNTPSAQTGNIENIADSANFFVLSKDGNSFKGTAADSVTIPNYTRYISDVKMNISEETAVNLTPTYTGERVSFTSNKTGVVTVDPSTGVLTPVARGTATITVEIYGTIGSLLTGNITNGGDCRSYDVSVSVSDPSKFENFNPMALESQTYTVNIPKVSSNQPGYFDMDKVVMTVTGIQGVEKSTRSAIITQTATTTVSGASKCTEFTVKYAKANSTFNGYDGIQITGNIVTKSIRRSGGDRYGHKEWTPTDFTTSRVIDGGVETATTANLLFDAAQATYSAMFEAYSYVDVTFNFNYWEYNPEVDKDGMINYPYDAAWAGNEDSTNANFAASHTKKTYTVSNFEVRNQTAANITADNLVAPAGLAIEVKPDNNYYDYQITAATIKIDSKNSDAYTAAVTVNMTHSVKQYKVFVNGTQASGTYAYQEYATVSHASHNMWYGVTSRTDTDTSNAPLLATGSEYKFRVKGNTYLRTAAGTVTDNNFNRSEVGFSHYETTHMENSRNDVVEYLLQNFYIADFFSPDKVLDLSRPNSTGTGYLPYDDAKFVGGGVVYYSMNGVTAGSSGTPTANALNSGYVVNKNNDYVLDEDMVKEMLKSQILASVNSTNYSNVTDYNTLAAAIGTEDAMKVAYGTEIPVQQYTENGIKTGILFRYLPLETFSSDSDNWTNGVPNKDEKGNYYTTLNNNTFRYSNSLQSYQYIYASGNENKATNDGRNMRLYSYYVYSYIAYNNETNVPETKYEVVLSDNYSDASTYWDGSTTE